MKLDVEKFKIIPTTYNAIDFMKIQYEDKDLVMKLKGEFFITDAKNYGLRLVFTPDDYSIIDKIYELGGFQNKSELNSISLSMNKTTPFFNHKNIQMDQNKPRSKSYIFSKSPEESFEFATRKDAMDGMNVSSTKLARGIKDGKILIGNIEYKFERK